jgi:hypothetical protein
VTARTGPRRALIAAAVILALLAASAITVLDGGLSRRDVLERQAQPAGVRYEDDRKHYIGVLRVRSRLLGRTKEYELYTGSDPSLMYGHYVELAFTGEERPVLKDAVWEPHGVRARFASGHEVLVPARKFMYGR